MKVVRSKKKKKLHFSGRDVPRRDDEKRRRVCNTSHFLFPVVKQMDPGGMLSARGRHGDGSRPAAPRVAFKCAATCAPIGRGAGTSQCIYAMDAVRPPKGTGKPIITGVKGSPRVSSTTASIKSHFVEENKIRPRTKQSQVSPKTLGHGVAGAWRSAFGGRTQFLLFVFLCHLISCSVLVIFSSLYTYVYLLQIIIYGMRVVWN